MNTLLTQFPLSPKKFWKKMIEKLFPWLLLLIVLFGISFFFALNAEKDVTYQFIGIIFVIIVIFFLCAVPYGFYVRAYIRRYFYDGNENFLTIRKGVFAPTEIHVQYQKIQDVYVDQDILDRIMGLYDVHIASATVTSGIEAHIDGVEEAAARV